MSTSPSANPQKGLSNPIHKKEEEINDFEFVLFLEEVQDAYEKLRVWVEKAEEDSKRLGRPGSEAERYHHKVLGGAEGIALLLTKAKFDFGR